MTQQYEDLKKDCIDCHNEFTITAGEQEFYATKQLDLPKRCKECRAAKKSRNMQHSGQFQQKRGRW